MYKIKKLYDPERMNVQSRDENQRGQVEFTNWNLKLRNYSQCPE